MFFVGTALAIVMVLIYTHLTTATLAGVIVLNVVLFIGIFSRLIPFQALMSQVPAQTQRGSFNAINSSVSQLAGGTASLVAGHIIQQGADGRIHHYEVAGYVVVATSLLTCVLVWRIQRGMKLVKREGSNPRPRHYENEIRLTTTVDLAVSQRGSPPIYRRVRFSSRPLKD